MTDEHLDYVDVQGVRIPKLGLGTSELEGDTCREAVERALEMGYRHVDTAQVYGNEAKVGAALRASGLPRESLFLTTKVWYEQAAPTDVRRSTEDSLGRLGVDYVDLLLLHWPNPEVPLGDTLAEMQRLQEDGVARRLGVSNFPPSLLAEALRLAPIVANQVEYHPFLAQDELRAIAKDRELALIAYSPLAQGKVREDETLNAIARDLDATPEQVVLRWLIEQPHVAAIPRSSSEAHLRANFEAPKLPMPLETFRRIRELARGERLVDPSFAPAWEHA